MAISPYLAMTPAEIAKADVLPEKYAGIYCPFSLEAFLPCPAGLLVLTDQETGNIPSVQMLSDRIRSVSREAVLLDFQCPGNPNALLLCKTLQERLPCPMVVSDVYARNLDCPVFLPPVPPHTQLTEHIAPWKGRDIWLDISTQGLLVTVTGSGSSEEALPRFSGTEKCHADSRLHCHYSFSVSEDKAEFTLWRTREDLAALLREAEQCGVKAAVGLYQELIMFR